ncbi:hypothetical protein ACFXEL_36780 [Streptomyces sp. NPDC059382]|uniref:hypothetical protein n=1 Tax=Streptomyces sp. NPDC059382 TaxID=3346816 RepID=UPI0036CB1F9B
MSNETPDADQQLRPWGTVTPAFWAPEQPAEPEGISLVAEPNEGEPERVAGEASRPLAVQQWFDEAEQAEEEPARALVVPADEAAPSFGPPAGRAPAQPADEPGGGGPVTGEEKPSALPLPPAGDRAPAGGNTVRLGKSRPDDAFGQVRDRPEGDRGETPRADAAGSNAADEAPDAAVAPRGADKGREQRQPPVPPEYQGRLAAVIEAIREPHDSHELARAGIEAEKLDEELTARFGGQHSHTVNIREIRGWLAFITGHPAVAARWYLHTTGLQIALHGAGHQAARDSVARAIHTWQVAKSPAEVVEIGTGLLKVVAAVLGERSEASRYVQGRLARYQTLPR